MWWVKLLTFLRSLKSWIISEREHTVWYVMTVTILCTTIVEFLENIFSPSWVHKNLNPSRCHVCGEADLNMLTFAGETTNFFLFTSCNSGMCCTRFLRKQQYFCYQEMQKDISITNVSQTYITRVETFAVFWPWKHRQDPRSDSSRRCTCIWRDLRRIWGIVAYTMIYLIPFSFYLSVSSRCPDRLFLYVYVAFSLFPSFLPTPAHILRTLCHSLFLFLICSSRLPAPTLYHPPLILPVIRYW